MKPIEIKTKRQLLIVLIAIYLVVFSAVAAICVYFFDTTFIAPLFAGGAVTAMIQYNTRKKQLPNLK